MDLGLARVLVKELLLRHTHVVIPYALAITFTVGPSLGLTIITIIHPDLGLRVINIIGLGIGGVLLVLGGIITTATATAVIGGPVQDGGTEVRCLQCF